MRVIDNTRLRARHIVRADEEDPGAVQILGGWWAPAPGGIEGRQGWQSANVERRVSDHGLLQSLALPNAAGNDGQLHRDRFAIRSDPTYRLGSEWIEFRDADTGRPLFVGTPDSARVDGTTVALTGVDAAGLLGLFREGKVAPWTPHGPIDVIDWYSRAPQQLTADTFGAAGLNGWTASGAGSVTPGPAGIVFGATGAGSKTASITRTLDGPGARAAWSLTVRLRLGDADIGGYVQVITGGCSFEIRYPASVGGGSNLTARVPAAGSPGYVEQKIATAPFIPGDEIELTIVAIDGWIIFLRDGAVVAQMRRTVAADAAIGTAQILAASADCIVKSAHWTTSRPFLRRGAPAPDYRVAGAPTPGGLRGDYFLTYDEWTRSAGNFPRYGAQVPAPLAEPYQRRLDPLIAFQASPGTWMPPGPPLASGFATRWSGSIYLDPATVDLLRLDTNDGSIARLWVGDTRAGNPMIDLWDSGSGDRLGNKYLVDHLGLGWEAGWYPIVLEFARGGATGAGIALLRWNGSAFAPVPTAELSPYGCWEGVMGSESHREAIDGVCSSMGIGWRLQPRTLESGEFPGRLEVGARLGGDTDYELTEDEATEYASEMAAAESVDRILADAAGLGDNLGREGLTAEIIDPAATSQAWVTTRYESLGEITEDMLLRQRLSSLLALYGSPMETVAARPRGQDELVREFIDTFPVVGDARLFLWEPDDGIRLTLPTIGVEDRTPRRITSVAWPLTPDGRGAPAVGFRQRPKHLRAVLQRLQRQSSVSRRHYQGQLAEAAGVLGGAGGTDDYSRMSLPTGRVARLTLRVALINGSGTIEMGDATTATSTGLVVTQPGEYDVTPWLRPGAAYANARLVGSPGTHVIQLVATVRV